MKTEGLMRNINFKKREVWVSSILPCGMDHAWKLAQLSDTLKFVVNPWIKFKPGTLPLAWKDGIPVTTSVRPFGILPPSDYEFTFIEIDKKRKVMRTQERGSGIEWYHTMQFTELNENRCRYTDIVNASHQIPALNPLLMLYILMYYTHRHNRWLMLLNR